MTKPVLRLSSDLSLPLDAVAETFAFLAKRGAGKTYAAMVLAEEMLDNGAQIVVLDPVSKWWGLRLAADGKTPAHDIPVLGGRHGDMPLSPRSGKVVAAMVAEKRVSVILDITLFNSDNERRQFVSEFAKELFRLKSQQDDPSPLHVFLEEAEEYVPQSFEGADAPMIGAIKKLCKLGRNVGIGVSLVSQRSADINKKALSQTEYLMVLRTKSPHDLRAIREWIDHTGTDEAKAVMDKLPTLPVGTAYVFGGDFAQRISVRKKHTLDTSKTPKTSDGSRKHYAPGKLDDKDQELLRQAMHDSAAELEAQDPRALKKRIAELEKSLATKPQLRVESLVDVKETIRKVETLRRVYNSAIERFMGAWQRIDKGITQTSAASNDMARELSAAREAFQKGADEIASELNNTKLKPGKHVLKMVTLPQIQKAVSPPKTNGSYFAGTLGLPKGARDMLYALRATVNGSLMSRTRLGFYAVLTAKGGTFGDYLSKLRVAGFIVEAGSDVGLTAAGVDALGDRVHDPMPSAEEVVEAWRQKGGMPRGARAMFDALAAAGEAGLSREDLGEQAGVTAKGGTFGDYLSKLRVKGLLDERDRGVVRLHEDLLS